MTRTAQEARPAWLEEPLSIKETPKNDDLLPSSLVLRPPIAFERPQDFEPDDLSCFDRPRKLTIQQKN